MRPAAIVLAACALSAAGGAASADPAPFHAFLSPAVTFTQVDSVVSVEFRVDSTATHFNAYEVAVAFDPALVQFQSVSEGALMTAACGSRFKLVTPAPSAVTYSHSLLCAGVSVDGPGVLCTFRFKALADGVAELAVVSPDSCTFLDAGICVSPSHPALPRLVTLDGAFLAIGGDPTGAAAALPGPRPAEIRVAPNPVRGTALFQVRTGAPGPARLDVVDVAGRRRFSRSWIAAGDGPDLVAWEAAAAAPGVYFVRVGFAGGAAATRFSLVR